MASPATVALLVKKAIDIVSDKRVRTFIASVIVGIVVIILIPFLAILSIFNAEAGYSRETAKIVFDGGPIPIEADAELTEYMEDMIDAFEEIDNAIADYNEEGFDHIKVKSFFISFILQKICQSSMKNFIKVL